ncbi:hypothetical protein JCM19301_1935 [Jejuia pallidilutea]|nr:hypothetical protein JCM19301_1935 [Jejuia pallidilutea]
MEKYEAGNSTLEEEQILFETADASTPNLRRWGLLKKHIKKHHLKVLTIHFGHLLKAKPLESAGLV